MKLIQLTQGKIAKVDDDDFKYLRRNKWFYSQGYAMRKVTVRSGSRLGRQATIQMHRVILKTPKGMYSDHINGDKLDNRKKNLRICTTFENARNAKRGKRNSTGFKGVSFMKQVGKFRAEIRVNREGVYLGLFPTGKAAHNAYQQAAKKFFGEFARFK